MDEGDTINVASLVLHTSDGQFVLQRRSDDAPTFPGMLCLFGGHIRVGEKPSEAAVREYHEELSVTLPPLKHLGTLRGYHHPEVTDKPMDVHIFAAPLDDRHFKVYEGKGAEWHSFDEAISRTDMISDSQDALKLFLQQGAV
jgi:8-oxo-dGTP diphosphatase